MADEREFVTEQWLYAGVRLDGKGKALHEWYTVGSDDAMWFSHGASVIGGTYSILVSHGENTVARFASLQFDRDAGLSEKAPEWTVLHRSAQAELENTRAEARLKREGVERIGDLTLAEARSMYRKATAGQKAGVMTTVIKFLTTGEPK